MSEEEKMKSFIRELFDIYYPDCGDIDGGELQDLAEKHGILVPEIRHEPCGEFCNCAQVCYDEEWQEGVKCYRLANWLSAEQCVHPTPPTARLISVTCQKCGTFIGVDFANTAGG